MGETVQRNRIHNASLEITQSRTLCCVCGWFPVAGSVPRRDHVAGSVPDAAIYQTDEDYYRDEGLLSV